MTLSNFANPRALATALEEVGYFADSGLAMAAFLALRLQRPLFLEGEPGVGKTAFAEFMAKKMETHFERLQCYEGIDAGQALYDWDFPRQILHLRALGEAADPETVDGRLYTDRFLSDRPILRAIRQGPTVLLIDEIDRADEEFEALLLEFLEKYSITIPEYRTITATVPPLVVLTSNRTREVHDALKRRCLYHWIPYPDREREIRIVRRAVPEIAESLAAELVAAVRALRDADLAKRPAISETIDGAQALRELGAAALDVEAVTGVLPTLVKQAEDLERVRQNVLPDVMAAIDRERRMR